MKTKVFISSLLVGFVLLTCSVLQAVELPVKVEPFLQKITTKYLSDKEFPSSDVRALAECDGVIYAGAADGIFSFKDDMWTPLAGCEASDKCRSISDLACGEGAVVAAASGGVISIPANGKELSVIYGGAVKAIAPAGSGWLAGGEELVLISDDGTAKTIMGGKVVDIATSNSGKLAVAFSDNKVVFINNGTVEKTLAADGTPGFIDAEVKALGFEGDTLLIGTAAGITKIAADGSRSDLLGEIGVLAWDDVTAVATGFGTLWVGSTIGAMRYDGTEWNYLQGPEYLADDMINDIVVREDGGAWIATPKGVSRVEYKLMTLEEKALILEKITQERHNRYNLISDSRLATPGDISTNTLKTSDNDGLWTAMYIAAECYRYGATGDPEAKKFARQSLEALMFLETVNETPGFISRSFARPDDPHGSGEWDHITSDGEWRWKGDTSSDEVDGHYYAYSVYYDVCADESEKEEIREKVSLLTNYIIDHDFFLVDIDGEPTTWGLWNPHYLNTKGRFQRNLNTLEALSFIKTAIHITGEQKIKDAYKELITEHKYAKYMVDAKLNQPGLINHSDDELAFLSYYPLLKYEDQPKLLEYYHKSIIRSWNVEIPERSPLFNFIYGAVMPDGTDFDVDGAIFTLKRISLDMVGWAHKNSHRKDIEMDPTDGRHEELQSIHALPPDERCTMKWNSNPYQLDKCGNTHEEAPTFWLLPYWMGRYYGFIEG